MGGTNDRFLTLNRSLEVLSKRVQWKVTATHLKGTVRYPQTQPWIRSRIWELCGVYRWIQPELYQKTAKKKKWKEKKKRTTITNCTVIVRWTCEYYMLQLGTAWAVSYELVKVRFLISVLSECIHYSENHTTWTHCPVCTAGRTEHASVTAGNHVPWSHFFLTYSHY